MCILYSIFFSFALPIVKRLNLKWKGDRTDKNIRGDGFLGKFNLRAGDVFGRSDGSSLGVEKGRVCSLTGPEGAPSFAQGGGGGGYLHP